MIGAAHDRRFAVRPASPACGRSAAGTALTMRQGLELDIEYVGRQSFALDL